MVTYYTEKSPAKYVYFLKISIKIVFKKGIFYFGEAINRAIEKKLALGMKAFYWFYVFHITEDDCSQWITPPRMLRQS